MNQLLAGVIVTCLLIVGLFFLRFWRQTRDRLFGIFALAFWVMALNRLTIALFVNEANEPRTSVYIVRLLAFLLILVAIVDKNYLRES